MPCDNYRTTITETSGPTELGVGDVVDGEYLKRVGDEIVSAAVSGSSSPTATVVMWAGNSASPPSGWLLCDGTVLVQATYPALFARIGTTFNSGGEAPHEFRLPEMRLQFPRGANTDADRGSHGGTTSHTHGIVAGATGIVAAAVANNQGHMAGAVPTAGAQVAPIADPGHAHGGLTGSAGTLPPFLYLHYLIKD